MALRWIVRIGNGARSRAVLGNPLVSSSRTLCQFPLIAIQVLQEVVTPLRRSGGPDDFQAAADRVVSVAAAKGVLPAQALLFNGSGLGVGPDIPVRVGRAVRL